MERFEIKKESGLEAFVNFIDSTKEKFAALSKNIKDSIKKYEKHIEDAETQIASAVSSREKCEAEINKMENKIGEIKDAIENVENTYMKIVEAYSSTSKGETKELYSDIIDGAKASCDKDVERNRNDIARLNSDIEAVKNNIEELNRQISDLEKDCDACNKELAKYRKADEYFEKVNADLAKDLDDINKDSLKPKSPVKKAVKADELKEEVVIEPTQGKEELVIEPTQEKEENVEEPAKFESEEVIEPNNEKTLEIDDALQRIYDLTGYKKEEIVKDEEPIEEPVFEEKPIVMEEAIEPTPTIEPEPVYTNNLENLFAQPSEDVKIEPVKDEYDDTDMIAWESILNGADAMLDEKKSDVINQPPVEPISIESPVKSIIVENANETVNQLLKPYGTTIERLQGLVGDTITYKDGSSLPFILTSEDVVKAINLIDGNDLRRMKTIGPEITIIKIVKKMKEGK